MRSEAERSSKRGKDDIRDGGKGGGRKGIKGTENEEWSILLFGE